MSDDIERKLTNIFSADVFGYSRMMGADEAGTLALLNDYKAILAAIIAKNRGRIVSTAGDGILAEFASSVMAVQTAVAFQRQIAERNQKLDTERQMWFRIGINLGDVIVEHDDIFGDDVNIAARLQALAEPGGVLVSGSVFEQVKNKLSLSFDFLGPQRLKNIEADVPAYSAVMVDGVRPRTAAPAAAPPSQGTRALTEPREALIRSGVRAVAIVALLGAINLFSGGRHLWFQWPSLVVLFVFVLRASHLWQRRRE